ncbi:MAG: universal stress protein [Planctomycetota bacterium]
MYEPTERQLDDDVHKSMDMFERAKVGDVAPIEPRTPHRVLVAFDGSSQDPMSRAVAGALRRRFDCRILAIDAREAADVDLAKESADELQAEPLDRCDGDSYDQILTAIEGSQCDLVVAPSPFGRDLDNVGNDSTGTVIDVLLARSPVPLMVVRQPYQLESNPFERTVMVLIGENSAAESAAQWAVGLTAATGRTELRLVVEDEVLENTQSLLDTLDPGAELTPETLGRAMERSHLRLHKAIDQAARSNEVHYRLNVLRESDHRLADLSGGDRHPLLVLAHERSDHASQGHVHDRIRRSPHPVFVVSLG